MRYNLFILKERIKRIFTTHERSELAKQSLLQKVQKMSLYYVP
jgi:hypothetical protein